MIRSTFVIDPQGLVEHAQYNVKATGHVAKAAPRPGHLTPRLSPRVPDAVTWLSSI